MEYLITFLEGLISFISPCMLPLLPVYISYFAGESKEKGSIAGKAFAFVTGFTLVFCVLGLFAGVLGSLLARYQRIVSVVCGLIVIVFGLSYLEILPFTLFKGMKRAETVKSIFSAFLFGVVYSVSLTPCVGAFLGSALMLASTAGSAGKGLQLLLCYSLGLGIPFLVSAVLLSQLKNVFAVIKKNYLWINRICGGYLIVVGICMSMGWLNRLLAALR